MQGAHIQQSAAPLLMTGTSNATPQAPVASMGPQQTFTPRSRDEIRRLFTKRPTPLQSASSQQPAAKAHAEPMPSRLQQTSSLQGGQHAQQAASSSCLSGGQAQQSFQQYACKGSAQPASSMQRSHNSSGHSQQHSGSARVHKQTSSSQHKSPAPNSTHTGPSAAPRASVTSAPCVSMRAEVLMGPAATIEVNVRFHDNIAIALKK